MKSHLSYLLCIILSSLSFADVLQDNNTSLVMNSNVNGTDMNRFPSNVSSSLQPIDNSSIVSNSSNIMMLGNSSSDIGTLIPQAIGDNMTQELVLFSTFKNSSLDTSLNQSAVLPCNSTNEKCNSSNNEATSEPTLSPTEISLATQTPTTSPTNVFINTPPPNMSKTEVPTTRPTMEASLFPISITQSPTFSSTTEGTTNLSLALSTETPTATPTAPDPSVMTKRPTRSPTKRPTRRPSSDVRTTLSPTDEPTSLPTELPTRQAVSRKKSQKSTPKPKEAPKTLSPTDPPTFFPTRPPTRNPTTGKPSQKPTPIPTEAPTTLPPTDPPTPFPTKPPTRRPTTRKPSQKPTEAPTEAPITLPPTDQPTPFPTKPPTRRPTTRKPSQKPTPIPTEAPITLPPTNLPTPFPTRPPTRRPTTRKPSQKPTEAPKTLPPTDPPTPFPTKPPTRRPTTRKPSQKPTPIPTEAPVTLPPTDPPTPFPTKPPTRRPTTRKPSQKPAPIPTETPKTLPPTDPPTPFPTKPPTRRPTTRKPSPLPTISSSRPTILVVSNFPTKLPSVVSTKSPATQSVTLPQLIETAKERIRSTIAQNRSLAANYLRLGFHDCVPNGPAGGCDGCINLETNRENAGLHLSLDALDPIVKDLENPILGLSRADIWALSTLVAADVSQDQLEFSDRFLPGRLNCETVGTCRLRPSSRCSRRGPDKPADFPTTILTTHELIDFMNEHFGFNVDETVALMGAHTLGKALPENSGYEGQNGWVTDMFTLDNEYYKVLAGAPDLVTDAPNWVHTQLQNGLVQWIMDAGTPPRQIFMLNVDVALVRDIQEFGFLPECTFHQPNRCPLADTLSKTGVYRNNNMEWLTDFKDVLNRMLSKGLNATV